MIQKCIFTILLFLFFLPFTTSASRFVTDSSKRVIKIPDKVGKIICSGSGCLRLISYFSAQDLVVAVDDLERRKRRFDARPYSIANPQYRNLPVFGGFRGNDNPEAIIGLKKKPDLIFKTYSKSGYDPVELQEKTKIPVLILEYGDLGVKKSQLFNSLRIIGKALERCKRAEELIGFFKSEIDRLNKRTISVQNPKSCFIGGIAFKGPHGFQSTEPNYPPFQFVNAHNIAGTENSKNLRHSNFSKEVILKSDPDILFLDLSTIQMAEGGLYELRNDPIYKALSAVNNGRVYGVLPYNWYTQNYGSIIADAWYIGKVLYPERFKDVDPVQKADDIYRFLLSKPAFKIMDDRFMNMAFKSVSMVK
ncbi:MAG: iron ABC transporter substrate-binding protein [Desulfobacterales bacterium]|nr:iron ABC transporter substrate-binding protein [Desulfobacterales bacterium]MCP4162238.1 iron ABC transporter substrate-binding protein [Deltaproteobacteria bacterium]